MGFLVFWFGLRSISKPDKMQMEIMKRLSNIEKEITEIKSIKGHKSTKKEGS
jgi:hypothetical protein